MSATKTRHTCGGPAFGRLTNGCPRCDELAGGAPPVTWKNSARDRARREAEDRAWIAEHFASARHNDSAHRDWCGPVCTFGDW